jgi:predicted RNA-binding Zn ribbon-like protein
MADERFGPTRRGGPVFRWLGERPAIDLANTVMVVRDDEQVDLLATADDLAHWLKRERDRLPHVRAEQGALDELRDLRDAVRRLLTAAADGETATPWAVKRVNEAAEGAPIMRRLERSSDGVFEAMTVPAVNDPLRQLLGALAHDAIDLVGGVERDRLHVCPAPSCGMFFVGRRRWCCAACGNRARVASHYRRTRAGTGAASPH